MDKGTTNSGIPVFGEVVKMLDKEEIMQIAIRLHADRYTKRLDSYQHLIIMLFATLGEFIFQNTDINKLKSIIRISQCCTAVRNT